MSTPVSRFVKSQERYFCLPLVPDGPAAGSGGTGGRSGGHDVDIITMLVGIYGSKELFVNEYQKMLSRKLLGSPHVGADLDLEYRTLELLKQRFGEESLHKCEVMLKDIVPGGRNPGWVDRVSRFCMQFGVLCSV